MTDKRPHIKLPQEYVQMLDEIAEKKPSMKKLGPSDRVYKAIQEMYDHVIGNNPIYKDFDAPIPVPS